MLSRYSRPCTTTTHADTHRQKHAFCANPTNVDANQHQSATRPARSPICFPSNPNFDHVPMSSAIAFTSSTSTGGGAYNTLCSSGALIPSAENDPTPSTSAPSPFLVCSYQHVHGTVDTRE
ncbi:hypothetical protein Ac2012v2_004032 [Leucoagaricus gongylophorus]